MALRGAEFKWLATKTTNFGQFTTSVQQQHSNIGRKVRRTCPFKLMNTILVKFKIPRELVNYHSLKDFTHFEMCKLHTIPYSIYLDMAKYCIKISKPYLLIDNGGF